MGKQPFVRDRISQGDIFLGKFPCIRQTEQKTCNGGTWSRLMAIFFVYSSGCLTVNELPGSSWFHKTDGPVFTPAQGFLSTQLWIFRNEMLYYLIKSRGKQISIQETAVAAQSVYICSSLFQRLHSNFLFLGNLYCRPELFRYEDLLQNDNHTNLEHAFTVANKEFSVPTLLDPSGEA